MLHSVLEFVYLFFFFTLLIKPIRESKVPDQVPTELSSVSFGSPGSSIYLSFRNKA